MISWLYRLVMEIVATVIASAIVLSQLERLEELVLDLSARAFHLERQQYGYN